MSGSSSSGLATVMWEPNGRTRSHIKKTPKRLLAGGTAWGTYFLLLFRWFCCDFVTGKQTWGTCARLCIKKFTSRRWLKSAFSQIQNSKFNFFEAGHASLSAYKTTIADRRCQTWKNSQSLIHNKIGESY